MNMRSLTFFGALVTALGFAAVSNLAACGNGTGGSGGTGSGGNGSGGNGSGGGMAPCVAKCAAAVTDGDLVCATDAASVMLYDTLHTCADTSCTTECMGQFDDAKGLDTACSTCLQGAACGMDFTNCSNDV